MFVQLTGIRSHMVLSSTKMVYIATKKKGDDSKRTPNSMLVDVIT